MKTKQLNLEEIEKLIAEGYIMKNKHPELNLWIYNYTQKTQYERKWNENTIQCRGIILDEKFQIAARPLPKFFNMEEHEKSEIPKLNFEVHEKLDGSLGVLYFVDGIPSISTRNSFSSKQAIKANELLHTQYKKCISKLEPENTYVFEIIYPENRIVVDYGEEEKLVLIAIVNTQTGEEKELIDIGFPLPKKMTNKESFKELKTLDYENQEGYVIKFSNAFRVKIKFENYVNLHKIITQVSSLSIWEQLREKGELTQWIEQVPDEFYTWVNSVEKKLKDEYNRIEKEAKKEYREYETKKETALYFLTCKHQAILFALYNKKNYEPIIWKMIKPKFEKAYSN